MDRRCSCWFCHVVLLISVAGASSPTGGDAAGTCNDAYGVYNPVIMYTPWDDLSTDSRKAAMTCGFDQTAWDGPSECWRQCFSDLSKQKQQAVLAFDTDAECYDREIMRRLGLNCTTKFVSSRGKRPQGETCDPNTGAFTSSPELSWDHLSPRVREAATTCGCSKKSWDGPYECRACFSDLSHAKRQAVVAFGTDAKCYDRLLKTAWGLDCSQLMQDMPDDASRSAMYAGLSNMVQQKFQTHFKIPLDASAGKGLASNILQNRAILFVAACSSLAVLVAITACNARLDRRLGGTVVEQRSGKTASQRYALVPLDEPDAVE